ncbi:MAG: hypothetical protein Q9179_005897 [Wetmoreana sp. 5 TL-2023]
MDPASFSFAVVGMFLTCCKGYKFLSDTSNARSDAQDAARRVLMQFDILRSWGSHFEIHPDLPEQQEPPKLKFHLTNDYARNGVFNALRAISETFTDVKRLDKKYGIVYDHSGKGESSPRVSRELQDFLAGRADPPKLTGAATATAHSDTATALGFFKAKMSLLERCQWSIRDKGRINNLVKRLKECNEDLQSLCNFEALAQMNRALPALALPQHKNFVDLHKLADIAEQSAQDKASPTVAGLERLAAMARFKARLMTPSKIASKYQNPRPLLDQRNYVVRSTSHPYSLGKSLESQERVFVEWQSYKDEGNQPNKLAEEQVRQLGAFLSVPHRPHEFRGLDCIGMFKDGANARYGMVYNLPVHLRNLVHEGAKNSRIYNPSTLTDLIRNGQMIVCQSGTASLHASGCAQACAQACARV